MLPIATIGNRTKGNRRGFVTIDPFKHPLAPNLKTFWAIFSLLIDFTYNEEEQVVKRKIAREG